MQKHWSGLTVFVDHPEVPMDNNVAERDQRTPVVARKNFYGSGSQWSGALAATMFSLLMTMRLWGINPRTWLTAYLEACAANGSQPPADLSVFLPWAMADRSSGTDASHRGRSGRPHRQLVKPYCGRHFTPTNCRRSAA
jgi:transposase